VDLANKLLQFAEMNLDKLQPKVSSQKPDYDTKDTGINSIKRRDIKALDKK
jgi:hypothetical protein